MAEEQLFPYMFCERCETDIPIGDWVNHCDDHIDDEPSCLCADFLTCEHAE